MQDRTNYFQSVIHVLKGNLGTGMLAMPMSFRHLGYAGAMISLPLLCLISAYCAHMLTRSSRRLGKRLNEHNLDYSQVTRLTLEYGPRWISGWAGFMGGLTGFALLVTQLGICCVYIVFVADNITTILASYSINFPHWLIIAAIYPITVLLGCIRTMNRLAIASLLANLLQLFGLIAIIEHLTHETALLSLRHKNAFGSPKEMALGFGSAMFAFEGISVVLPVYNRLENRRQFGSLLGIINVSSVCMLFLYFTIGLLGYMRYGSDVRDSITLNLPAEPLYDAVRAMFTVSILLSYPLQCWVPNEMIWEWIRDNLIERAAAANHRSEIGGSGARGHLSVVKAFNIVIPVRCDKPGQALADFQLPQLSSSPLPPTQEKASPVAKLNVNELIGGEGRTFEDLMDAPRCIQFKYKLGRDSVTSKSSRTTLVNGAQDNCDRPTGRASFDKTGSIPVRYEYLSRFLVVSLTFVLALSIPKLNLLMDLVGSFSGNLLCLAIPAMVHLVSYCETPSGHTKRLTLVIDLSIIALSVVAGVGGSYSSVLSILGIN